MKLFAYSEISFLIKSSYFNSNCEVVKLRTLTLANYNNVANRLSSFKVPYFACCFIHLSSVLLSHLFTWIIIDPRHFNICKCFIPYVSK